MHFDFVLNLIALLGASAPAVASRQAGPDPGNCRGEEPLGRVAAHALLRQVHEAHEAASAETDQRLRLVIY